MRPTPQPPAGLNFDPGDEYFRLVAEGAHHLADQNYHRADKTYRKAIALEPGEPFAYFNLGAALSSSGRHAEAAPLYLQAAARYQDKGLWRGAGEPCFKGEYGLLEPWLFEEENNSKHVATRSTEPATPGYLL